MNPTMLDMAQLREELMFDEGVVYEIYKCSLGYPTFGIGHLIRPSDKEYGQPVGTPVGEYRVLEAFDNDIESTLHCCRNLYGSDEWFEFPGEVKKILANMCFNLGVNRLSKFVKMNAAIKEHNWKEAAREGRDSKWYRQVTNRAERLMTRMENV